jgi:hypothetical protein
MSPLEVRSTEFAADIRQLSVRRGINQARNPETCSGDDPRDFLHIFPLIRVIKSLQIKVIEGHAVINISICYKIVKVLPGIFMQNDDCLISSEHTYPDSFTEHGPLSLVSTVEELN